MNRLASETALKAKEELNSLENQNVSVPLGSALGIKFLAGTGPRIRMRIIPIGAVSTGFESTFESAGINQTEHRLLLDIIVDVDVLVPWGCLSSRTTTSVIVAETMIVGSVPDMYVNTTE